MEYIIKFGKWAAAALILGTFWVAAQNENPRRIKALEDRVSITEQAMTLQSVQLSSQAAQLSQMDKKLDLLLSKALDK